jgi:antibiotic biosynthesis monooxygenase (ABM) superfamily enzyme
MSNRAAQHTPPAAPPRYKLALLTWAGACGAITLILGLLGPTMAGWPLVLRTLLISVLMTTALTWIVLPGLTRLFRAWLLAADDRSTPRPVPSTWAPGSGSWAPGGASQLVIDGHDRVQG